MFNECLYICLRHGLTLTLHWNDYEQKNPTVLQSIYHKTQWKVTRENPIIISFEAVQKTRSLVLSVLKILGFALSF